MPRADNRSGAGDDAVELLVIGGGPAGYPAAFYAADLGMQVTLVDDAPAPGGVCLHRGCIPSKALLHVASLIDEAAAAAACGVHFGAPRLDIDAIRSWKRGVVDKLTGGLSQLAGRRGVRYLRGRAALRDARSAAVETDSGALTLAFQHAIIATGSLPARPPGLPASERVMDSSGALQLPEVPGRLLVVGGGYIGLELGQVYAALGSAVTVVEMLPALLSGADADLVKVLRKSLDEQFERILLEHRVTAVREDGEKLTVTVQDPSGANEELRFDRALVSVGRKPNTKHLELERAGVDTSEEGFIRVDSQRRTSQPAIFAAGDAAGQPMLAHKATHEARLAVDAIRGGKAVFEPRAVPAVVFTRPEVAWAGLTEAQAAAEGTEVRVARFPWAASGRATTLGATAGFTKLIADPECERVLGLGIVGPGAGELIAEGVLAIEMGACVEDLALTIHPHPTLSETLMEAAEAWRGAGTHVYARR